MGCVISAFAKNENEGAKPGSPTGERRRLSVLKPPKHAAVPKVSEGIGKPDGGQQFNNASKVETLLELLPEEDDGIARRRFSLVGQQAYATQKGFENKNMAIATANCDKEFAIAMLDDYGIGYSCKKGLKLNNQYRCKIFKNEFSFIISFENKNMAIATANCDKDNLTMNDYGIGYSCKKGLKPESPNQDDFFVMRVVDQIGLYGVFDGHGPFGHDISHFTHQLLPAILLRSSALHTEPAEALNKAFLKTHQQCQKAQDRGKFDCSLSGTTASVCVVKEEQLQVHVANVGDSRAIIAIEDDNGISFRFRIAIEDD